MVTRTPGLYSHTCFQEVTSQWTRLCTGMAVYFRILLMQMISHFSPQVAKENFRNKACRAHGRCLALAVWIVQGHSDLCRTNFRTSSVGCTCFRVRDTFSYRIHFRTEGDCTKLYENKTCTKISRYTVASAWPWGRSSTLNREAFHRVLAHWEREAACPETSTHKAAIQNAVNHQRLFFAQRQ